MASENKSENVTNPPDTKEVPGDVEQATPNTEKPSEDTSADSNGDDAATNARKRQERFKALQARAVCIHQV